MKLFGKEVDPKELLGMTPEELQAKLDGAVTKKELEELATEMRNAQTTSANTLSEIKAALAGLKTPVVENVDDPSDDTVKVLADPKAFVDGATKNLREQQVITAAQLEEMKARSKYSNIFDKHGEALGKFVEKMSLADKARPGFWDWATSTFLGEMVKTGKIKPESFPSLMGSSTVAVNADGSRSDDPDNGFAAPVAAFFRERGLDLKKMKVINDTMARDGEPITLENYHARQKAANA